MARKPQIRVALGRRHVLRELHAGGPRTPAEIAAALHRFDDRYTETIVRERLHELAEQRLVRLGRADEVGIRAAKQPMPGRPKSFATLTDAWGLGVGIEVGRSVVRGVVTSAGGTPLSNFELAKPLLRLDAALCDAGAAVHAMLGELDDEQRSRVRGVVVALPAPIDRRNQTAATEGLPGSRGEPLDRSFADILSLPGIPVMVANDANARAVAEGRFGLARAAHSAFVLKVSGGIGGALLRRGRVQDGYHGLAGEAGHLPVLLDPLPNPRPLLPYLSQDARCSCGDAGGQHLEAFASTTAVAARVAEARGLSKGLDFATVAGEWKVKGDARRAVEDAARLLGQVLASITVICDPALFVVTGRFASCGPDALEYARAALQGLSPRRRAPEIRVDGPAGPGAPDLEFGWIGAIGAARMAIEANTSADDPPSDADALSRRV